MSPFQNFMGNQESLALLHGRLFFFVATQQVLLRSYVMMEGGSSWCLTHQARAESVALHLRSSSLCLVKK